MHYGMDTVEVISAIDPWYVDHSLLNIRREVPVIAYRLDREQHWL